MQFGDGRYELVRELGRGGMGQVFEVRILATGGRAALKTLHPALAKDPDHLERFRREAIAIGTLEHPHLVRCFDFGISESTPYLVMELVEGDSLQRLVEQTGRMDPGLAIRIGQQVASALELAHGAGVIHRDLKPSNILTTTGYDGGLVAKVIDFGVASIKQSGVYRRLTGSGEIVGTPNYMAPEQVDSGRADARTDVYGVGALLYGLVAGQAPYPGPTLAVILQPLLKGERLRIHEHRSDLGELAEVIERAMSLDPNARYQTVRELGAALRQCSAPTVSHDASPLRPVVVIAALLAFLAGIGLVLTTSDAREPEDIAPIVEPVTVGSIAAMNPTSSPVADTRAEPILQEPETSETETSETETQEIETSEIETSETETRNEATSPMRARGSRMGSTQSQSMASQSMASESTQSESSTVPGWERIQIVLRGQPGEPYPSAYHRVIRLNRAVFERCMRELNPPVRVLDLDLVLHGGGVTSRTGEIIYPHSECVEKLLDASSGASFEYEGRVHLRIVPIPPDSD